VLLTCAPWVVGVSWVLSRVLEAAHKPYCNTIAVNSATTSF
jgi:hypothetical protein